MYQLLLRLRDGICVLHLDDRRLTQYSLHNKRKRFKNIETFIKNVSHRCHNILKASKDAIKQDIKWF